MITVDKSMIQVAEDLAREFGDLPLTTVIRVLTDCLSKYPTSSEDFVEHAARVGLRQARLHAFPQEPRHRHAG